MVIDPPRYRGTPEYNQAREIMITAARARTTFFYRPILSEILGLEGSGEHIPREIGQLCGEISEDEHLAGRPLLSAVAINQENHPGSGFFNLARALKLLRSKSPQAEEQYWLEELQRVHDHWSEG